VRAGDSKSIHYYHLSLVIPVTNLIFLALNEIIIYRMIKDERLNLTGFVAECRSRIPVDILNNEYIIP
jgi:hypothetical protein